MLMIVASGIAQNLIQLVCYVMLFQYIYYHNNKGPILLNFLATQNWLPLINKLAFGIPIGKSGNKRPYTNKHGQPQIVGKDGLCVRHEEDCG